MSVGWKGGWKTFAITSFSVVALTIFTTLFIWANSKYEETPPVNGNVRGNSSASEGGAGQPPENTNQGAPVPTPSVDETDEEAKRRKLVEESIKEYGKALDELTKKSSDLKNIITRNLPEKKVGGLVAVILTNWQFNQHTGKNEYRDPSQLGFKREEEEFALVNLAVSDKIKIEEIRLWTRGKQGNLRFGVTLKVRNTSKDTKITCLIPKGQVFESVSAAPVKQNLATALIRELTLGPNTSREIEIPAYCINKDLPPPEGAGNITIYEINRDFKSQNELWEIMRNNEGR